MNHLRLPRILLLLLLLTPMVHSAASALSAMDRASHWRQAGLLVDEMTPEERVGQLFLVTFEGATAGEDSAIADLILNHYIGGVVLLAENDNFVGGDDTVAAAYNLISQLQIYEWRSSQTAIIDPVSGESVANQYIPLLVGISQPGGGAPSDQIMSGLTPLPSQMAIGATWDVSLAEQVGKVAGMELAALGFNLFLGPSLDVLDSPESTLGNGLGVGVFGGDPFWVAQMGQAYTRGLHTGSDGRMLVVARHFPGRGSSDRPIGGEPATVRKPLESLKQIELAPFFAVTGDAPNALSRVDGLLVSHIRYQGFQGNIRATTRPVSFDPQALALILALPEFASWSTEGGLIVSDDLGSETVRRFYDPLGTTFLGRTVARDAFLAGNDLLYLGNIKSTDKANTYETVLGILSFFVQKYREDAAFAQRVDNAVQRILAAKLRLYGSFQLSVVIPPLTSLGLIGGSEEITFEIARQGATLVNPAAMDLDALIPAPPDSLDDIVIITDTRTDQQCSSCSPTPRLGVDAMKNAILRLYGPLAGGDISAGRLVSVPLDAIPAILAGGGGNSILETSLRQAEWLVINLLDAEPGESQTVALQRFLSERQDLLRGKNVIVFSFDAPYYFDSTDLSKMTAYYCLYSRSAPFIDVAVRILFQELTATGALPVSVSGVGYDLFTALTPDPDQVITLFLEMSTPPVTIEEVTPAVTPTTMLRVGDNIIIRTGVLVDHNSNPVPDGTSVHFVLSMKGGSTVLQSVDAVTTGGVARASFRIDTPGLLEIRARSEPAEVSVILQLDVSGEGIYVTMVAPTSEFNSSPTPADSLPPEAHKETYIDRGSPGLGGWLLMLLLLGVFSLVAYFAGERTGTQVWAWRWGLCTAGGSLLAYLYLALRLPGAVAFIQTSRYAGIGAVVFVGALLGWVGGYLWRKAEKQ